MTKSSLVFTHAFPDLGRIEAHIDKVALLLLAGGFEIAIATTNRGGQLPKYEIRNKIEITRHDAYPRRRDYFVSFGVLRLVATSRYDLVHIDRIEHP